MQIEEIRTYRIGDYIIKTPHTKKTIQNALDEYLEAHKGLFNKGTFTTFMKGKGLVIDFSYYEIW